MKNMTITLKVTPLTYAILMQENPAHEKSSTIIPSVQSPLIRLLTMSGPLPPRSTDILTHDIHIYTERTIPEPSDHDKVNIAHILHADHRAQVMRWMQSAVAAGQTASHGMRTFMHHYDMDDDAFNRESTFRAWQRWVRYNTDVLAQPKEKIVSAPRRIWNEQHFEHFIADMIEYLYHDQCRFNYKRMRSLRLAAMNNHRRPGEKIITLDYKGSTAYAAITSAKRWIKDHPKVKEAWQKYYPTVPKSVIR